MNSVKPYGIGIVGCGTIADVHAQAIQKMAGGRLVSVYSRHMENAERLSRQFNVSAYDQWDAFIRDDCLDIVSICTPSGTHLDYGRRAALSGKHLIVEKPIEVTRERAEQLINIAKQQSVALAVIFQSRFMPEVLQMKKAIDEDQLGKIFLADAQIKWYRGQDYYDSAEWRGTLALDGGGVLINQAIHTIDLLQWMMGPVESIYGQMGTFTHRRLEGEDAAVACLRFQSGVLGTIQASTSMQPANVRKLEVYGEKATALLLGRDFILKSEDFIPSEKQKKDKGQSTGASSPLQGFSFEPHQKQLEAIVQAMNKDKPPPVSGEDSLKSLAIVRAIYKSAQEGGPVVLAS